jgi:hypothetical protein
MAKQTFTTGQVLTAAQMTSLQQTAMGGGSTTAKTANYVLVAADAGTTVAMDAATATTITVDTGLFAAGDTVFIQNIGAGDCTITAGTATVDTAGSLILPQYDAGILYFTSASAAIFYDYIQVGAASPLTTKGDLYTYGTSDTRLGVGANGTTLVADSAEATGLKWATPASGGAVIQVVSTTTSTPAANSTSTYADTGLTASITPTSASNNILVIVTQNGCSKTASSSNSVALRLLRGSTTIAQIANETGYNQTNNFHMIGSMGITYLDSPATTSSTTYKTQFMNPGNIAQANVQGDNSLSAITLIEVTP